MKATVLVDNIGDNGLKGEWGLCVYIEYKGKKILLDAGASGLFSENAKKLSLPLEDIDYGVLSHAHYDHADGIREFFRVNKKAKFYLRDACKENCYAKKWIFHRYIGISKGLLSEYQDRIESVSGDYEITEGVTLIPHKGKDLSYIGKAESMVLKEGRSWRPDDFSHEQSLVFDTPDGLVIFNSCSHGGADHIIREVAATYPDKKVLAMIGGFHLFNKSENYVKNFAERVLKTDIRYIYTGHCTGEKAFEILKSELGDKVQQLKAGLVMEF